MVFDSSLGSRFGRYPSGCDYDAIEQLDVEFFEKRKQGTSVFGFVLEAQ